MGRLVHQSTGPPPPTTPPDEPRHDRATRCWPSGTSSTPPASDVGDAETELVLQRVGRSLVASGTTDCSSTTGEDPPTAQHTRALAAAREAPSRARTTHNVSLRIRKRVAIFSLTRLPFACVLPLQDRWRARVQLHARRSSGGGNLLQQPSSAPACAAAIACISRIQGPFACMSVYHARGTVFVHMLT